MAVKRRSGHITLVLVGAALLNGCDRTVETRDMYASRGDCVRDWGDDRKCEQGHNPSTGSYFFLGPAYTGARSAVAPRGESRAIGTQSAVRGGFGASARSHAASAGT